jgi:hypothetical protein
MERCSLKAEDQRSWDQSKTTNLCGLCGLWECRSRFNVLCLRCLDKVNGWIQQQIRVFGPIVGDE